MLRSMNHPIQLILMVFVMDASSRISRAVVLDHVDK